jgi:hypothetical protein
MFNRCEGLPNGACPDNRQDKTVKNTVYDLFLCPACEKTRDDERSTATGVSKEGSKKVTKQPAKKNSKSNAEMVNDNLSGASAVAGHSTDRTSRLKESTSSTSGSTNPGILTVPPSTPATAKTANSTATPTVGPTLADAGHSQSVKMIIDELLTYAVFHRDRCTHAELHSVIVHFYSPIEISTSKANVMNEFEAHLTGCKHITTRRQTATRTAHDAEIDDIMGMLELLDNLNVLNAVHFVALSIDRLPKYGPNEINICSVVDRQIQIDTELSDLKQALHNTTGIGYTEQFATTSDKMIEAVHTRLTSATDSINGQLQQLAAICRTMTSPATHISTPIPDPSSPAIDRTANIIVFGLTEDANSSTWNSVLLKALQHVAGRPVEIADAFRIGRFNANQTRPRPIIVKLRNVWDKRLLLSNARKLADVAEFRRIGFAPDEPLETRRKNTMKRLQLKARNAGQRVSTSDDGDGLFIDGSLVFSLKSGFNHNGDVSNSNNGTHG